MKRSCISVILSLTAWIKSSCPAICDVTTENRCHLYLSSILNIAAVWCSNDEANCSCWLLCEALCNKKNVCVHIGLHTSFTKYSEEVGLHTFKFIIFKYCKISVIPLWYRLKQIYIKGCNSRRSKTKIRYRKANKAGDYILNTVYNNRGQ